ncbi:MAG: hypothetical protein ACK4R3_03435, partial [Aliihoeflea sp.]
LAAEPLGTVADHGSGQGMVALRLDGDGDLIVTPLTLQDSSMLRMLAQANCLIVRPPFAPALGRGDACRVLMLRTIG